MKESKSFILKLALKVAVQAYNQEMALNSSDASFMSAGFFHGEKGKTKGIKASAYLEKILNTDHDALFLLLYCLMDSSSKSLATSIAEQLIQGSCMFTYGLPIGSPQLTPSLRSNYFTANQINRHQVNAVSSQVSGEQAGVAYVDRRRLVKEIIKQQRRNMSVNQKTIFDSRVLKLKSNLRATSSSEIKIELLPPLELSHDSFR